MAFKPLSMETVLEKDEGYDAQWKTKSGLAPRTTEDNIALQHQLDFASAEDFISFPSKGR